MGDIYNNPPQSRNEAILRATIDGTEYEAPPQSRMEDLLVELKEAIEQGACIGNYNDLSNKPQINGVALQGDRSISDLFDGKVDIGVGTVEESGYAELKDENGDRIFRAGSANGGAAIESGALIGQSGALVLYNGEGGLGSVCPKGGASLVEVDLPAESGTLALDSQIASSQTPAKASVVTVTDAAPINAEDITVDITPQQDLHGYDRPWAGGAGKNLCPFDSISFTANSTWCSLTGAPAAQLLDGSPISLKAGTYYASMTSAPNVDNMQIADSSQNVIVNSKNGSFTLSADGTVYIRIKQESTSATTSGKLQIESGSSATAWQPYSNICPITGYTGAELDMVGKNRLPHPFVQTFPMSFGGVTITDDNGRLTINNTCTQGFNLILFGNSATVWGSVDNAKSLPVSDGIITISGGDETAKIWINQYRNGALLETYYAGAQNITISVLSTDSFEISVRIVNGTSYNNLIISPQIEAGSTATAYEPYQGEQYTASFGETVHGGKWHVTEGGTDKTLKKVEYNGSEYWQAGTALTNVYRMAANIDGVPSTENISSYLSNISNYTLDEPHFYIYNGKLYVFLPGVTSDAEFATYLAQHPLQICYELATPTTISTPKQNVPMLKGINTVSADCGDVSLKYQPDNVIGELKGDIREVKADMSDDTFSERGIDGEYQITRIGNEIHIAAIIDDASIATQTGSVDLIADLPDAFRCNSEYTAVLGLRHSSGTGKIEFKIHPGTTQNFYMYVEEVNTTSGIWFPIYDVPGKAL